MSKKIAIQGELGANSHIACQDRYPDHTVVPCLSFDGAFQALRAGEVDLAMMPIENTVAGRVADIHRLLPGSGLYIIGEHFMRVRHCLLGIKGAAIDGLTHVHSHEMALGQCRNIITARGLKPVVAGDTAGAAQMIANLQDKTQASIASALAAEIYGLDILQADIEDSSQNVTRFLVLSAAPDDADAAEEAIMTSFIFRVRNVPAALYKALGGFATNGVNMSKIESYQPNGSFAATQFYADIEGHPDDERVRLALEELKFYCSELDILGVYPAAPERGNFTGA
jgi:prephenate dehydratase